jgi:mono/diheme cytochrome c family protein
LSDARVADITDITDPIARGRILFLAYGCAACHGVVARGGIVGPKLDLQELWKEDFVPIVRSGPGGMPAFTDSILSDVDLDSIYAFLKAAGQGGSTP